MNTQLLMWTGALSLTLSCAAHAQSPAAATAPAIGPGLACSDLTKMDPGQQGTAAAFFSGYAVGLKTAASNESSGPAKSAKSRHHHHRGRQF